jgi:hypothetical protein
MRMHVPDSGCTGKCGKARTITHPPTQNRTLPCPHKSMHAHYLREKCRCSSNLGNVYLNCFKKEPAIKLNWTDKSPPAPYTELNEVLSTNKARPLVLVLRRQEPDTPAVERLDRPRVLRTIHHSELVELRFWHRHCCRADEPAHTFSTRRT